MLQMQREGPLREMLREGRWTHNDLGKRPIQTKNESGTEAIQHTRTRKFRIIVRQLDRLKRLRREHVIRKLFRGRVRVQITTKA